MPLHAHLLNWLMLWRADDQTAGSVFVLPKLSKKNVTGSIGLSNTFSRLIEKVGIEIQKCGKKPGGWREVDQSSHIASTACAPLSTTDFFIDAFKTRRDFFTFGRRHAVFFCEGGPLKQR